MTLQLSSGSWVIISGGSNDNRANRVIQKKGFTEVVAYPCPESGSRVWLLQDSQLGGSGGFRAGEATAWNLLLPLTVSRSGAGPSLAEDLRDEEEPQYFSKVTSGSQQTRDKWEPLWGPWAHLQTENDVTAASPYLPDPVQKCPLPGPMQERGTQAGPIQKRPMGKCTCCWANRTHKCENLSCFKAAE